MEEKLFNLLHDPWIMVMQENGTREELSLIGLFQSAHRYKRLAGELPPQDVAVTRLLLAVMHAVFSDVDLKGEKHLMKNKYHRLDFWKDLWSRGSFPSSVIGDYLESYSDRFWLFHPTAPFYQIAGLKVGTEYSSAKLNGELAESSNKTRLFSVRSGEKKFGLTLNEACRWLLFVNGYDDTSAKPKTKGLPSPGVGWLGKLGLINAVGNNLFESLMLNFVLWNDIQEGNEKEKPIWECVPRAVERNKIHQPDNLAELYTLQSRRIRLIRDEKVVTGYLLLGGDFFDPANSLLEPMTIWIRKENKTGSLLLPKRHNPQRQLWRDFASLLGQSKGQQIPGVISWLKLLQNEEIVSKAVVQFETTGVKYGDKDFFIDDIISDSISFSSNLLCEKDFSWVNRIIDEINTTYLIIRQLIILADNLAKALGSSSTKGDAAWKEKSNNIMEQAYFELDFPFRRWLESIDPRKDEMAHKLGEWRDIAIQIIRKLGEELTQQAGPQAFSGREITERIQGKDVTKIVTAPKAFNQFIRNTASFRVKERSAVIE